MKLEMRIECELKMRVEANDQSSCMVIIDGQ